MSDITPEVGRVTVTVDDLVATILLDRPAKHNALTPEMIDQLDAVLAQIDADRTVRAVVVAGAGDRSFCAGADIKRFKALAPLDMWASWTRRGLRVFDRLADLRQPTIAAVSGNAYGGGLEIALACDLRVIADDATRRPDRDRDRRAAGLGRDRATPRPGRRRTGQGDDLHRRAVDRGPGARLGGREPARGQGRRHRRRHRAGHDHRGQGARRRADGQAGHRLRPGLLPDGAGRLGRHRLHRRRHRRARLLRREAPAAASTAADPPTSPTRPSPTPPNRGNPP